MTATELRDEIGRGSAPAILDVRTEREYAEGHVPGALNIPFNRVGAQLADIGSPREAPLVVYCGHGPRAWIAARALRRAGFTRIDYLKGHWAAWRRAGFPQER